MKRTGLTGQRLTATFLVGCVLFNYPVLALFARRGEVLGIPLLVAYVFGAWVLLIAVMALVVQRGRD